MDDEEEGKVEGKFDFMFIHSDDKGVMMKKKVARLEVMSRGEHTTVKLKGNDEYNRNDMRRHLPIEIDEEEER